MRALTLMTLLAASCITAGCDSGTTEAEEKGFAIDQEFSSDPADPPATTDPGGQPGNNPGSNQPGTTPPPADTPADTGLSCEEIYTQVGACYQAYDDCASPCQDQACADACEETYWGCFDAQVALGSSQGQSEFNSVRACEDQHYQGCYDKGGVVYNECAEQCSDENCAQGCADQANAILKGCMEESCNAEFVQCGLLDEAPSQDPGNDPPQNPETPAEDGLSCKGIYDAVGECYATYFDCASPCQDQACADACEETYWSCFDTKVAEGGPQAQVKFKALRDCEDAYYQECYDEGGVVYNDCAAKCADEACTKACAQEANAVLKDCMVSYCQNEFDTCGVFDEDAPADPGNANGELACGDLYTCEDACNGDPNCGQACYDKGSEAAKSQWTSLIKCGQIYCDGQVPDAASYKACLQQMCSSEYGTCFSGNGGGQGPDQGGGQGTCGAGLNCIKTCYTTSNSEQAFYACVDVCYGQMSGAANTLIDALAACADVQCTNVPGSIDNYFKCQQDFCPTEYNACMNQN